MTLRTLEEGDYECPKQSAYSREHFAPRNESVARTFRFRTALDLGSPPPGAVDDPQFG